MGIPIDQARNLLARAKSVGAFAQEVDSHENESTLHGRIIQELKARGWPYMHGSTAHRTHRTKGEPDFVILAPKGRVLLVECKSKTGKLSVDQRALLMWAARLGHTIHVVQTMREFEKVIEG